MEVPRLGVESELQLPDYAIAKPDPSRVCHPQHSSRQHQILNPLSKAMDWTLNLMVPSWISLTLSHDGNSWTVHFRWVTWRVYQIDLNKVPIKSRDIQVWHHMAHLSQGMLLFNLSCPYFFFFFGLSAFSRAAPAAYGGSQARGQIGAAGASPHHSNARSQSRLQSTP